MKKANLILLGFLLLAQKAVAQEYVLFVNTLADTAPHGGSYVSGKANNFGKGLRRAYLFETSEPDHYGLEYKVNSVHVRHATTWDNGDTYSGSGVGRWLQVWIHENTTRDLPGDRVIKFEKTGRDLSHQTNGFRKRYHDRDRYSPSDRLKVNSEYWIVFDVDYSNDYDEPPGILVARSPNHGTGIWNLRRGFQATAWDDGERNSSDRVSGWWNLANNGIRPLQFAVRCRRLVPSPLEIGDTIRVGNLDEPNFNTGQNLVGNRREAISAQRWVATSFYTSSSPGLAPHVFSINHLTMLNPIRNEVPSNTHFIRIHPNKTNSNGWNHPDQKSLGEFSPSRAQLIWGDFPGRLSWADQPWQNRFSVRNDQPIFLKPNTIYWLVQGMVHTYSGSSPNLICFTQSTGQKGWPVGDKLRFSEDRGFVWHNRNYSNSLLDRTMRFELNVTVLPAKGDLNRDARINLLDLVMMNNEIAGFDALPTGILDLANIDGSRDTGIDGDDRNLLIDLIMER